MVDSLATKYVEARKGLDDRIEELQAENKGLVDKAIGAIKAVIGTIRELVSMLTDVLARAAGVVGEIIKHPVGFLGNLIAGVKGGILKFKDNILDHLRKGLMSWLFGALAEGGIELPDTFDVKGIIKLLASIFGLTWANIRNRIVRQIGEKAMAAAEKGVEIFQIIASQGIAGLWQMLVDKLGDIKEMILEQAKDFVITKIITAGITWLIGLLNPAAAFIKACKLIYDVVMFFVNNASRILKFVNTVIDSVADIVRGNVSAVIDKIDDVLGQMVPIIIGFLASVIGLGGIGEKIREIIQTLQKPVNKALDFIIKTGLKLAGPIIRGLKGISGKVKAKLRGGDDSPEGKQKRLEKGMTAGVSATNRFADKPVGEKVLRPILSAVRVRYGLGILEPTRQGENWAVHGEVQRATALTKASFSASDSLEEILSHLTNPPLPALKMALHVFSPQTNAFVTCPDKSRRYVSSGGRHAEWAFHDDIRANMKNWIDPRRYPEGSTVPITVKINRTPCDTCSLLLQGIQNSTISGRRVALTVLATSLYGGRRFEETLQEGAPDKWALVAASRSSLKSLATLRASGVKLGAWDIWDQIGAAVLRGDPRLKGIDPGLVKENQAQRPVLENWLEGVRQELAKPTRG